MVLFVLSSCGTSKVDSANTGSQASDSIYSDNEKGILGTWETNFNGHTTIFIFETGGNGLSTTDMGNEFNFTYEILNDHQISLTMVTIEGVEDTSIYEFTLNGDSLVLDDMEYVRK